MAHRLVIKVKYGEELRRLPLYPLSLQELHDKVKTLFELQEPFTLKYQDDEDEFITMKTTKEMYEAIELMTSMPANKVSGVPILRLFVMSASKNEASSPYDDLAPQMTASLPIDAPSAPQSTPEKLLSFSPSPDTISSVSVVLPTQIPNNYALQSSNSGDFFPASNRVSGNMPPSPVSIQADDLIQIPQLAQPNPQPIQLPTQSIPQLPQNSQPNPPSQALPSPQVPAYPVLPPLSNPQLQSPQPNPQPIMIMPKMTTPLQAPAPTGNDYPALLAKTQASPTTTNVYPSNYSPLTPFSAISSSVSQRPPVQASPLPQQSIPVSQSQRPISQQISHPIPQPSPQPQIVQQPPRQSQLVSEPTTSSPQRPISQQISQPIPQSQPLLQSIPAGRLSQSIPPPQLIPQQPTSQPQIAQHSRTQQDQSAQQPPFVPPKIYQAPLYPQMPQQINISQLLRQHPQPPPQQPQPAPQAQQALQPQRPISQQISHPIPQPSATLPQQPQQPQQVKRGKPTYQERIEAELIQLRAMGFTDEKRNTVVLLNNQGNLELTVAQLLSDS